MRSLLPFLACTLLPLAGRLSAATPAVTPGDAPVFPARLAWRVDPLARCPQLRRADDGVLATVVFYVDVYGFPSHASIRSSSQSATLDAAAVECVMQLRFQPATRPGDAEPQASWQEMAWRWAAPAAGAAAAAPAAGVATPAVASAARAPGAATVRACADEKGQLSGEPTLVHSSGDAALDQAALAVARAGAAHYRPATSPGGAAPSGCAEISVRLETR